MNYLNLEQLKKHLNIDADFTDDDAYIESLGEVAESIVEKHLDRKLDSFCDIRYSNVPITYDGAVSYGDLPAPIVHAMLLMVGNLYANRESVTYANTYELPLAYQYLLAPYHNYMCSKL